MTILGRTRQINSKWLQRQTGETAISAGKETMEREAERDEDYKAQVFLYSVLTFSFSLAHYSDMNRSVTMAKRMGGEG